MNMEEHQHQFWKDGNPPNCLTCGKTQDELFDKTLDQLKKESFQNGTEQERARILKLMEGTEKWPEPSPDAGQGGPGPLWTAGMLTQYVADKNKHEAQITVLKSIITNEPLLSEEAPKIGKVHGEFIDNQILSAITYA